MAELILFAIVSAFAGVYALYPKHRQVRLQFCVSSRARRLGIIGFIGILLTALVGIFATDSNSFVGSPEWLAIDYLTIGQIHLGILFITDSIQILIVLGISAYLFYVLSTSPAPVSDWHKFGSKVREFRDNQQYPQLADLLNEHYDEIFHHNPEVPDKVDGIIEESIMNKDSVPHKAFTS